MIGFLYVIPALGLWGCIQLTGLCIFISVTQTKWCLLLMPLPLALVYLWGSTLWGNL